MSDTQSNINTHFLGRDGFLWWIGQIPDEGEWRYNRAGKPVATNDEIKGYGERYRVRIMGNTDCQKTETPDDRLVWANVMYPVTAGGGGRASSMNSNINQGDFVYGFYMDGEDMQAPIIMGIIGNNEFNKVLRSPPADKCFVPYSGFNLGEGEKVSFTAVPQTPSSFVLGQTNSQGPAANYYANESTTGDTAIVPVSDYYAAKEGHKKEPIAKPSECDKNPLGDMQLKLSNAMQEIQNLKKTQFDDRLALALGTAGDIAGQIENICEKAAEFIAGILKKLLNELLQQILNKTGEQIKETEDELNPSERPTLRKVAEDILEQIVCLFRKLIDELLDMAKEFVCDAADKAITTPACLIENFVGNLLSQLSQEVDNVINTALEAVNNLVGGSISVGGGIGGGLEQFLSFLSCDDDIECSPVNQWSILGGADQSGSFSLDSLFNVAGSFGGSSSATSFDDISFGNIDSNNSFQDTCDAGPQPCGPPTLKIFGGGGSGAVGNLIVSALGEILGADMVSGGSGYNNNTFAIVNDPCGVGGGAVINPIIEDGEIIDIIVIDPGAGYLPEPDGSKGGDGNQWSDPVDTIIIRDDVYDPPTPPGNVVDVVPGDSVELPPGTTIDIIGDDCTQTIRGGRPVIVTCGGKFTTPDINYDGTRGSYPNLNTGSYPTILYLCEIRVLENGMNYASTDEVIIEPDFGAKATLKVGDQGIIESIKVIASGEGITEMPKVYIKSETGINAVLVPKLCIDRVGVDQISEPELQDKVVQVIDCVGKFDV